MTVTQTINDLIDRQLHVPRPKNVQARNENIRVSLSGGQPESLTGSGNSGI
ncbi:hypothetical protein EG329_012079 [Mollisiaceae sp. DMI_Dod_QoI]|nr:hypothetical protein EG329_012079 [Helotiales sp. DMI_Dod_QoI]